ncbi:hypothetical protein [Rhodococcus yananensis]|uniref:hypothetical protein n=1 Tax=Rhodococcus yananensis TaxID=2879464 RepID=UPI001CF8C269|nr:hypothetical protein [Rhodococcus yananensis]
MSDGADEQKQPSPGRPDPQYFRGEHGRVVPRAAWWSLGLALALLLAFVIVRPSWFTDAADDVPLDVPPERHFTKTLAGSGHVDGVWLTDDAPSTSFLVTLPADSGRDETRLHLTGTTQVAEDTTVFLSVSMDGQQVLENRLPTGEVPLDLVVDVPHQVAEDGRVRVRVHAEGTRHDQSCTPDHSAGLQIHLDPTSVLEAALVEPVHTVRDAVASWDRQVTIVLVDRGVQWRTTAAQLGMALTRAGQEVRYAESVPENDRRNTILVGPADALDAAAGWTSDTGADGNAIVGRIDNDPVLGVLTADGAVLSTFLTQPTVATADTSGTDPRAVGTTPEQGNEVPLESLGADMSVGSITETRSWQVAYSLADLPDGRIPEAVRVSVALPASPQDLTWILNTRLGGKLVDSRKLNDTAGTVTVPLAAADQVVENSLTFTVQRDRDLGGCDVRVTSYPTQLRADSALVLGNAPGTGFTALPRQLAPGFAVHMTGATDDNAVEQLNSVVGVLTAFTPAEYVPDFLWNTPPDAEQPFILVGDSPAVAPRMRLADGRIVSETAGRLDISSFDTGLVVETATNIAAAPGLVIRYAGDTGEIALPDFGTETALVVTSQGSFEVRADGTVPSRTPPRENIPR